MHIPDTDWEEFIKQFTARELMAFGVPKRTAYDWVNLEKRPAAGYQEEMAKLWLEVKKSAK